VSAFAGAAEVGVALSGAGGRPLLGSRLWLRVVCLRLLGGRGRGGGGAVLGGAGGGLLFGGAGLPDAVRVGLVGGLSEGERDSVLLLLGCHCGEV
jgi:hypothetical protein